MATHQCTICGQEKAKHEFRWNPRFGVRTECRECEKQWLRCSGCKGVKTHDEFPPSRQMKTGRHSLCNDCHGQRMTAKYRDDPEFRKKHKEHSRGEKAKAWRRQHWQKAKGDPSRKAKRNEYMLWLYHSDPIHRLKIKARSLVAWALKNGKLTRSEFCEECGIVSRGLEGHHYAGYWPRATWLMVKWLCQDCHVKADMSQGSGKLFIGFGLPELAETEAKVKYAASALGLDQEGILKMTTECLGEDECEVILNFIGWLGTNGYEIKRTCPSPCPTAAPSS